MNGFSLEHAIYPIPRERWAELIAFWQHEWPRTDVDWLESMRGSYADSLVMRLAVARQGGRIAGSAAVYYPAADPEVCCVADVVTHPDFRGQGVAAALVEDGVQAAFAAGCRAAYLGNAPRAKSVYERIGFRRFGAGAMMRRPAPGAESAEAHWHRPDQPFSVRETSWGDLPGVACVLAQPLSCWFVDYPRGILSARRAAPMRCVSGFATVWNGAAASRGLMLTLVGETRHRVLGFGTLTPGPGVARAHRAVAEAAAVDGHAAGAALLLQRLIEAGRQRGLAALDAFAADEDASKIGLFESAGFRLTGRRPDQARIEGKTLGVSEFTVSLTGLVRPPKFQTAP